MAILPIVTYDDKVLREEAQSIEENTDELQELIDNMFETMYNSNGVGLAAPQIGKAIRLFIVDADPLVEDTEEPERGPFVFINPEITETGGPDVQMEEGCLSIPDVREDVVRPQDITIQYKDRNFNDCEIKATGWLSRVIQHENDHIDGVLFIDYLSSFKKRLIRGKLKEIAAGNKDTDYPLVPKTTVAG